MSESDEGSFHLGSPPEGAFDEVPTFVGGYSGLVRVAHLLWIPAFAAIIARAGFYRWPWVWVVTGLAVIGEIAFFTSPMKFEVGRELMRLTWLSGRTRVLPLSAVRGRAQFSIWALLLGSLEVKTPDGSSISIWPRLMTNGARLKKLVLP